ncbi:uncharacterized protein LOC106173290 [Lingula anatina]|uniref:Uncharacterized protein LOC106173290 n=1 Tax=Lingula anatina TaxID=7574 RepID=A0A1S3JIT9_LINAN|nr:uncharacterized protein LOC106173290 [Lingula anatina]|eukprot:XP_013409819.1 uncharacterized protein LOC106173290 [Lingula anatina]
MQCSDEEEPKTPSPPGGEGSGSSKAHGSTPESSPVRPKKGKKPVGRPRKKTGPGRPRKTAQSKQGSSSRGGRGKKVGLTRHLPKSLSSEDVQTIRGMQDERKAYLKGLMSAVSREELEEIIVEVCDRSAAIGIDVEHSLKEKSGEVPQDPQPSRSGRPTWCVCGHCREMPSEAERVCCNQQHNCRSEDPIMTYNILNTFNLAVNRVLRGDYEGGDNDREEGEEDNASMRHAAYRAYICWQHHKLTLGDRRVIPACCVWKIRDKFPSPTGQYKGFLPWRRV